MESWTLRPLKWGIFGKCLCWVAVLGLFSCGEDSKIPLSDQQSGILVDGKPVIASATSGLRKQGDGFTRYTITANNSDDPVTKGYFLQLEIPNGASVEGAHTLSGADNKFVVNLSSGNLLTVYNTFYCQGEAGVVTITEYNEAKGSISGHFSTKVCNKSGFGEQGERDIAEGRFQKVALKDLD